MMTKLRKNMTIVFIIVILSFVLFIFLDWGRNIAFSNNPTTGNFIATVNKIKITSEQLNDEFNRLRKNYLESSGKNSLTPDVENQLKEEAFNQLVTKIIFDDIIKKYKYNVYSEEIYDVLYNVPPENIKNDQRFYKDGKFDFQLYKQIIDDPNNIEFKMNYYKQIEENLPKVKIQTDLVSGVKVQNDEISRLIKLNLTKVQVEYIVVPTVLDVPPSVSDEEAKTYFEKKKYLFEDNNVILSYIQIMKEPSNEDILNAKENIEGLRNDILNGNLTFEKAAELYSDDYGSSSNGGYLGYFKRGKMVKEFEDAAFGLKSGEISKPVKTAYGWHLIKVEDIKKDSISARHILIRTFPSYETQNAILNRANNILNRIKDLGFEKTAELESLKVYSTLPFNPDEGFIKEFDNPDKILNFVRNAKQGDISKVIELNDRFVIVRIDKKNISKYPEFEVVKEQVKDYMLEKKKKILSSLSLLNMVKKIKDEKISLEKFAKDNKLIYHKTALQSISEKLQDVDNQYQFFGALFAAQKDDVYYLTGSKNGYIFRVLKIEEPSIEKIQETYSQYLKSLHESKQTSIVREWMNSLRKKYIVNDYR